MKKGEMHVNFQKIYSQHGFELVNIHEGIKQPFREVKKTLTREVYLLRKK